MNNVVLIGRLTKQAELKYTKGKGTVVLKQYKKKVKALKDKFELLKT